MSPTRRARVLAIVASALTAAALVGCVRVETPPLPVRTASPATIERDVLADALAEVSEALATADSDGLQSVESRSIDALISGLGEPYVAYPEATATASPSPAPELADAVQAALDASVGVADSTDDPDVHAWAVSSALVHGIALWVDTVESATLARSPAARALPIAGVSAELALPSSTGLDTAALADLALRHDQARYLYELVASRLSGAEREDALARADLHAERSDALQALAGGDDSRTEVYSSLATSVADAESRAATLIAAENAVASAYASLAVDADATETSWLLDGAYDAYAAAVLVDGWAPWDLPLLPGLDAASATPSASATASG